MVVLECSWRAGTMRISAPPGCASVALACHAAPHHRSKGRKCASLHCLGARASRSRATLRLITGARVGSMRPCTAWVRERRARVSRCASSQEQGSEVRVPAPPGCASVALACRAAPHHRSKGRKCASLHCLGARASRSRVALRLITGARVGSARPCTAWVRERRARVPRCASSHKQQGRGMLRPCCDLSCCWL